jgi:hypothetical protein
MHGISSARSMKEITRKGNTTFVVVVTRGDQLDKLNTAPDEGETDGWTDAALYYFIRIRSDMNLLLFLRLNVLFFLYSFQYVPFPYNTYMGVLNNWTCSMEYVFIRRPFFTY